MARVAEVGQGPARDELDDEFDLERFVSAQRTAYGEALAELAAGRKRTHWIWFIFPQLDGLGRSSTARYYAIKGVEEARAYLAHPVLGARLVECTQCVNAVSGRSALEIFGEPDDLKFCSSMTLFEAAAGLGTAAARPFADAIEKYYSGQRDRLTLSLLGTK